MRRQHVGARTDRIDLELIAARGLTHKNNQSAKKKFMSREAAVWQQHAHLRFETIRRVVV